jgi:hypothetical protein
MDNDSIVKKLQQGRDEIYQVADCLDFLSGNFYAIGNNYIGGQLDEYSAYIRKAATDMIDAFDQNTSKRLGETQDQLDNLIMKLSGIS